MTKIPYESVVEEYQRAKELGVPMAQGNLADFANTMQGFRPNEDWSAGRLPDNWVTKISRGIDTGLQATQLPQAAGAVTGGLGSLVDTLVGNNEGKYQNIGQEVGQGIPRGLADIGLFSAGAAATFGTGGLGAGAGVPMMAAGLGDAFAKGYTESGSVGSGLISAGVTAALPGVSSVGAKLGMRMLPKAVLQSKTVGDQFIKGLAGAGGAEAANQAMMLGSQKIQGQEVLTSENLFGNLVQSAAFLPWTVGKAFQHARVTDALATVPGQVARPVDPNNWKRVLDFVLQNKEIPFEPDKFDASKLKTALELSGLIDPQLVTPEEVTRRNLAMRTIQKLATNTQGDMVYGEDGKPLLDESGQPQYTQSVEQANLVGKALKLLQAPETQTSSIGHIVRVVQMNNKFRELAPLELLEPGQVPPTVEQAEAATVVKSKVPKMTLQQQMQWKKENPGKELPLFRGGGDEPEPIDRKTAFDNIALAQRGAPEEAMNQVAKNYGGGVYPFALEHIGDIIHRMTQHFDSYNGMPTTVLDKIDKTLRSLTQEYGFAREKLENEQDNARIRGMSVEEYRAKWKPFQEKYVEEHSKLPVYNEMQELAQKAAVALGKEDFPTVIDSLTKIREAIKDGSYSEKAGKFGETNKDWVGNLVQNTKEEPILKQGEIHPILHESQVIEQARPKTSDGKNEFFETPAPISAFMTLLARVRGKVLDPSSGRGSLLRFLKPGQADSVTAVELRKDHFGFLKQLFQEDPNTRVVNGDFIKQADSLGTFDTILMNPPFRDGVTHLVTAYEHLNEGGRLVAIVDRRSLVGENGMAKQFKAFLEKEGATLIQLPWRAFKSEGTNVDGMVVVMEKGGKSGMKGFQLRNTSPEEMQRVLQQVDAPLYKAKIEEPMPVDPKTGFSTTETINKEIERLTGIEHVTPEDAVVIVTRKLRAQLADNVEQFQNRQTARATETNTPEFQQAYREHMSKAFDKLGIDPGLKELWMGSAERILNTIIVHPDTTLKDIRAFAGEIGSKVVENLRGLYFPESKRMGLNPEAPSRNPALALWDILTTAAHEMTHSLIYKIRGMSGFGTDDYRLQHVNRMMEFATGLNTETRTNLLYATYRHFVPEGVRTAEGQRMVRNWVSATAGTPEEFVTELSAVIISAKMGAAEKQTALRYMAEPIHDFMQTNFRGVDELFKILSETLAKEGKSDLIEGLQVFHQDIERLYSRDPIYEGMKQRVVSATTASAAIEQGDIGGASVVFKKSGSEAVDAFAREIKSNPFTRFVCQLQQTLFGPTYRNSIPEGMGVISALTRMDPLAVTIQHTLRAGFMVRVAGGLLKDLTAVSDRILNPEQIQKKNFLQQVAAVPRLTKLTSKAMLISNELTHDALATGGEFPTFDHPSIQNILKDLAPDEYQAVSTVYHAYEEQSRQVGQILINHEMEKLTYVAARYLHDAGTPFKDSLPLGQKIMSVLLNNALVLRGVDDTGKPVFGLPSEFDNVLGAEAVVKHWNYVKDRFYEYKTIFDKPYFTEMRSGKYGVKYTVSYKAGDVITREDGTEVPVEKDMEIGGYRSTDSKTQWKAIMRDVQNDPRNKDVVMVDRTDKDQTDFGRMQVQGLQEAANLVKAHYEAAMEQMDPELASEMRESGFSPAEPLIAEIRNRELYMAERKYAPGREWVNMIRAQDALSGLVSRQVANSITRVHANWLLQSENWNKDPKMRETVQEFKNNVLSEGRQKYKGFRRAVVFMTMGANVSSAMVDATQPWMMGVWRATELVGAMKAVKLTAQAYTKAFGPWEKLEKGYADLLAKVSNMGLLKTGTIMDDFFTTDEKVNFNVVKPNPERDLLTTKDLVTDREFLAGKAMEMVSEFGEKGSTAAMISHRMSSQVNNKVSLWVGYQIGKERGLKGTELDNFAIEYMQVTNVQGSRAAHSAFKLKAGQANGIVEAATLLTNYPLAAISQMVSTWKGMLKSSGVDAPTRKKSAQAFAGQLLAQFAMAGTLGFGLDALFKVANQWWGVDPEEEIRKSLAAIDKSGTLGEVLLNGVGNMVTGVDLQSRFSLSGIGGMNPNVGFDPKGLFGAGGGMISALYNAPGELMGPNPGQAQLLPNGVRKMVGAITGSGFKDRGGQQIIDPTEMERVSQFFGFKSARMARVQSQRGLMKEIDQATIKQAQVQKQEYGRQIMEGNVQPVVEGLKRQVVEELSGLNLQPGEMKKLAAQRLQEKLQDVVKTTVEHAMPYDPMSVGSVGSARRREELAKSYGNILTPRAVEMRKLGMEQQMMNKVGMTLQQRMSQRHKMQRAQAADSILQTNPTMARSRVLQEADTERR